MWPLALVRVRGWVVALLWLAAVNGAGVLGASVRQTRYEGPMGKQPTLVWGIFPVLVRIAVEPYVMYGVYAVLVGLLWSTARRVHKTLKP